MIRNLLVAAFLLGLELYMGGAIVIVGRLRRIFQTLIGGDPFHPDNVRRLRVIGSTLALLEVGRYAASTVDRLVFHGHAKLGCAAEDGSQIDRDRFASQNLAARWMSEDAHVGVLDCAEYACRSFLAALVEA